MNVEERIQLNKSYRVVDWIHLAHNRDRWKAPVDAVIKFGLI